MSKRNTSLLVLVAFLAACGGNPFTPIDGGGHDDDDDDDGATQGLIPESVSMAMEDADLGTWQPGDSTFTVQMTAQDATDLSGDYQRDPTLDVGPYQAYTYQTTTSNRKVVALVHKEGGVAATVAVDAGQFANYHGGGQAWRADVFTAPPGGGVGERYDYSGTYAGLLNIGSSAGGPGGTLDPTQAYRTTGRALVTADFTEMRISGGVDQRTIIETGTALPDIALWATDISADGTFTDEVYRADPDWTAAGTYGGAFSSDGEQVAVVMVFNPTTNPDLFEHGVLVLDNCASAGGPACP